MKRPAALLVTLTLSAVAVSLGQSARAAAPATTHPAAMDTHLTDASYGIGFNMGKQLSRCPV